MSKEMVISVNPHETRVAILEEGQLCEYYVEREKEFALVGSIYKGRVTRVLPGMQSAFVEIGLDSDAFLYVSDFLEDVEDLDSVVTTAEEKIHKIEEQGGHAFAEGQPAAAVVEPTDVEPSPQPQVSAESEGHPGHIEPLPGEHFSPAPAGAPRTTEHGQDQGNRPRFEGRGRGGRERDFGRRGGRGRGGRFGRRGRGGDRDRRHGAHDLPQSKYARPYEVSSPDLASQPEGHVSVILPGESFAKYKFKPASEAPGAPTEEGLAPASAPPAEVLYEQTELSPSETPAPPLDARVVAKIETSQSLSGPPSSTRVEPLPGESISKWRHEPASEPEEPASSGQIEVEDELEAAGDINHGELTEEGADEEVATNESAESPHDIVAELSEDEAAALAQHVAETQLEQGEGTAEGEAGLQEDNDEDEEDELASFVEAAKADVIETSEPDVDDESTEGFAEPAEPDAEAEVRESLLAFDTGDADETSPAEGHPEQEQPVRATVRGDFRARMHHPARRGGRDRDRGRDRGHRHHGGGHHRAHHRPKPQLISDLLKQGQEIIVQIAKEPLGKKGARITSHIALPGRYLVYMPTLHHTGVSRKIASAEERSRLRHLVNEAKGTAGGGFIVRTAAASAPPEDVRTDVEFLTKTWADIKSRSEQRKAPSLLHRDLNLVERILRDFVNNDFGAIWVDSEEEYTKVVDFMSRFQPALVSRVKLYTKETPVFEEFGIQQEIDKGLRPKVWLKSGGYIVINHTEALVAIDVNTGKFVGKGSTRLEDTIVRTNLEAVKEIVRQMRLRDLGGIIIIDFIDMEERRNREKVMAALEDALRADRAPSKMLRFNEFGLIAITRKRTKQALERTLCQPCPYCTGSGMVKSVPTLCYEIQAEAKKMAPDMDSNSLTLRVHPEISKALKTRESGLIEELERWTKKSVIIQADPSLHWEQYDIY